MERWKFYGRQREAERIDDFMDRDASFDALIIRGRRQVGKTELVKDFFEFRENGAPVIIQHLSSGIAKVPKNFLKSLKRVVRVVDPSLLDGYVEEDDAVTEYPLLVAHLLWRGCTVVIDEFQRIAGGEDPLYLQGEFQKVIDDLGSTKNATGTGKPRLIVMGSAQQKLMEMFKDELSPLYERITEDIHVRPFDFDEIAEMAKDQGWDARPNRLLTLWSAYGGMPDNWQRFRTKGGRLVDFTRDVPDPEWTDGFLEFEERYRKSLSGTFERKMKIELRPLDRMIIAWLTERERGQRLDRLPEDMVRRLAEEFRRKPGDAPSGFGRTVIPEKISADIPLTKEDWKDAYACLYVAIEERLSDEHLGLLENRSAVDDHDVKRWYVADHFARFQFGVLEKAEKTVVRRQVGSADVIRRIRRERLARTEGYGLETLATAALRYLFPGDDVDVRQGVWRRTPNAEIDALVVETGSRSLWLGSCERDPERQAPEKDWRHFMGLTEKVEGLKKDECPSVFLDFPDRRFLFVSPVITDEDREELVEKVGKFLDSDMGRDMDRPLEWFTLDIADMLDGRGPRPMPMPEPKARKDDGTDFGM